MRKLLISNGRGFDSDHIVVHYSAETDMTFITYEVGNTIEVVGFYFGEPCESNTEQYIGSIKCNAEEE